MNNNIIETRNIVKTYGKRVKTDVLKKINLKIEYNSFNWIIGPSGSGKTTLLNIISGLDSPTSGSVIIHGKNISLLSEKDLATFRANHLGFVFQFHYLLPEFTALENVLMPLRIQKKRITRKIKKEAIEVLEQVGLGKVYKHYPKEMSGGEQQRVAIARAIMGNPELIIADEPTGNLDSENAKQIYKIIRELHQKYNKTFIIVTHDEFKPEKGDRTINLKDGNIIKDVIV